MAVSVANPLSPAEAEATLEAGAAMVGVDLVDLSDLECLAELPDEVARAAFRKTFTPDPSPGRGAGPYWAPCAADGRPFALEVKPEPVPAPLPTSAPLQPGSFFMYGTSAQAQRGGLPRRASEIVAAHQHEMVASFLQHQHNSAGQTELAEDSFSSAMSEATTQQQFVPCSEPTPQHQFVPLQQHQFVPAPQFVRHNSSSSSLMSVAQQPTPDATCATVISEATSVLAVAQNLVPGSLKEIFDMHVMCDYTARIPKHFPTSRWATLEELVSKLQQHAPAEVARMGPQNLRQLITDWFKDHPNFADLPFSAWGKRLKNNDPQAHSRSLTFKFCFEHTPGLGLGR